MPARERILIACLRPGRQLGALDSLRGQIKRMAFLAVVRANAVPADRERVLARA